MEQIYNANGLVFWNEQEIALRESFRDHFARQVQVILREVNPAWTFLHIEAPLLTPTELINPNYTKEDVWMQEEGTLVLRPETTPGSYAYAVHLLRSQKIRPPFCVWQAGKSFRREQDQVTKNMRLKEFYQQEFQCIFAADTANDYLTACAPKIEEMLGLFVCGLSSRLVESDRLPDYSLKTLDVEIDNGDKWMEVCSMSLRKDFPEKAKFMVKNKEIEKDLLVFEIAIGLDRCVYNFLSSRKK